MDFGTIIDAGFSSALGTTAIVYALASIGLNIQFGYTGLLNFGQAGFMVVGAFGLATSVVTWGIPFWPALVIALVAPMILAILLGVPTLRLRADYLAIATIAAAEVLRFIIGSVEAKDTFGGSNGLTGYASTFKGLNPYEDGLDAQLFSFSRDDLWSITVGWVLVALGCLLVWALMRSPWGRVLRSIREDEHAVRSLGKNVYAYKMQALVLGGFFGGLAGVFLALKQASAVPTDYGTNVTFYAYTALLIGGAARVLGPVIGAMIFWFLMSSIRAIFQQLVTGDGPNLPTWLMDADQASLFRLILVGLGLMLLMIFRPQGIFGDRREIAIDGR